MGSGLTSLLDAPFYTGTGTNSDTPFIYQVAINGHGYIIDPTQYERQTIPAQRQPIEQSVEPGETSLNTEGIWRRSQENWVLGAGQEYFDNRASTASLFTRAGENQSLRYRFFRSKGVNPWDDGRLSLLHETEKKRTSSNTNLQVLAVGTYLYVVDGGEVYWTADPTVASPSFTAANIIAGGAASAVVAITTDGSTVWALLADKRIQKTTAGASSSSNVVTMSGTTPSAIGYANGRLVAAIDNKLFEVTRTPALVEIGNPANNNPSFVWTAIAGAPNAIYACGYAGIHGEVYSIGLDASTGALTTPVFASGLPFGEIPYALKYYGGVVVIATSEGIRLSDISRSDNALVYGPLVPVSGGSRCLDPYNEFMWFGWSNMSTVSATDPTATVTSTGLGRADLARFTATNIPAYASDVMATDGVSGTVLSCAYFGGKMYFAVSGSGIWGENANLVSQGFFQSGLIRFGTIEKKVITAGDWRHDPLDGTVGMIIVKEDGTYVTLAEETEADSLGPDPLSASLQVGEAFQVQMYLKRSNTATLGPNLRRWTIRALVTPQRMDEIIVPIILRTEVDSLQGEGQYNYYNPYDEFAFLKAIEQSGQIVTYQEGKVTYRVYVDRVQVKPGDGGRWVEDRTFFNCTMYVRLLTVPT